MKARTQAGDAGTDPNAGLLRLIAVGLRRYSTDPTTRASSAQLMLSGAVALYAAETSPGEAALVAAEFVAGRGIAAKAANIARKAPGGEE